MRGTDGTDGGGQPPVPVPRRLGATTVLRGVPRSVWLVTALFAVLLSVHAVLTPLYRAPDEARHVDTVLSLHDGRGYPPPGKALMSQEVLASYLASGYSQRQSGPAPDGVSLARLAEIRAALPLRREDAPDFEAALPYDEIVPREISYQINQMTQHPPLYYLVGAAVLEVAPGDQDWPFPYVIGLLRLLSVAMLAPLPLLAHAAARRLLGPGPPAVAAAAVPLGVPQLAHIGSSVSNDNLLVLAFGVLTVAVVHVLTGDLSRRTAVVVGLAASVALLTKAFALAALPFIVTAYLLALVRTRHRCALVAGLLAGVVSLSGLWWWLLNLVRYGTLQPEPLISTTYPAVPGFSPSVTEYAGRFASNVTVRFWGNFGYLELPVPTEFAAVATGGLALLCGLGVLRCRPRAAGLVLLVPVLAMATILVVGTWGLYATYAQFPGLQGRYLFPALPALAVLAGGGAWLLGRRWGGAGLLAVCLLMHLYGLRVLVRGFWQTPGTSPLDAVGTVLAWSYWPEPLVVVAVVAAGALAPLALWSAVAEARSAAGPAGQARRSADLARPTRPARPVGLTRDAPSARPTRPTRPTRSARSSRPLPALPTPRHAPGAGHARERSPEPTDRTAGA